MSGIPSCSMFWDFGSLHQKHRASSGHLVVYLMTGLMVGDRRFPGASILGARFSTSSANHPVSVPPTGPEHADASWCGQCTRWQVQYSQTGATLRRHFLRGLGKFRLPSGRGHLFPAPTWEGCRATLLILLSCSALPAGGCRSSGWELVLLAVACVSLWLAGFWLFLPWGEQERAPTQ